VFACLYSRSTPVAALLKVAEDFTPRFQRIGPLVMLDVNGLSHLFGSPQEIGRQLRRSVTGPVRIAMAPTQTAAALLAWGRVGLTVAVGDAHVRMLAPLSVSLVADWDRVRHGGNAAMTPAVSTPSRPPAASPLAASQPPHVGAMEDVLPYLESCLDRTSDVAMMAHCGGGWTHPRDAHAANLARWGTSHVTPDTSRVARRPPPAARVARSPDIQSLLDALRRWGVTTCGDLVALPSAEISERLGQRGVQWQRLARGEDAAPLVPSVADEPFEATRDLEWPIEGLQPLSFVLSRLIEPLAARLERADRGAAIVHTHLRLVSKAVHERVLQLPAPMRDPKTLRTLILLDMESSPPSAAIDQVRVCIEPTPGRVTQWMLFERAQPSPEQVSTLLARLAALMGATHVGSPRLVDSWRPGVFEVEPFDLRRAPAHGASAPRHGVSGGGRYVPDKVDTMVGAGQAPHGVDAATGAAADPAGAARGAPPVSDVCRMSHAAARTPHAALRRFRFPVPARVQVQEGRPVRLMTDRHGVTGGPVVQAAGPWRTSGDWWNDAVAPARVGGTTSGGSVSNAGPSPASCWDRDEWDIALADGTVYRIYVERDVGQWFIDGIVD
jgi:protein ImuB